MLAPLRGRWPRAGRRPRCATARSTLLDAPGGVLAFERAADGDRRRVLVGFGARETTPPAGWAFEVRTDGRDGGPLAPDGGALLRPDSTSGG